MANFKPEDILTQIRQKFGIIGNSEPLTKAILRAHKVARTVQSVLIYGENGTGKENFSKIIVEYSDRRNKPFISVNCGAIPESTIDSELFGHKRGAYTGAETDRAGYFETVNGGTIFLDEIGEMPLSTQARLLRLLESGEFIRMGESEVRKTNVRVIAATNRNLLKAVEEGSFREDLFYRLAAVEIQVPPLRVRGNDIVLLARIFSHKAAEANKTQPIGFSEEGKQRLLSYDWPGNVRQLQNLINLLSIYEEGNTQIGADTINANLPEHIFLPASHPKEQKFNSSIEYNMILMAISQLSKEIQQIKTALGKEGITLDELHAPHAALAPCHEEFAYQKLEEQLHCDELHQSRYSDSDAATFEDLVEEVSDELTPAQSGTQTINDSYRDLLLRTLKRNHGQRRQTAIDLNISERTLYRKIKEFGFDNLQFK